ncbi:S16 family serine protease, partial [Acinetobacter baumannii]
ALISALSWQPVDQQIAVTGSVDQFGFVQAIGGVNEKIEGFFRLCQARGLTGKQGVIIPASNERHLVLSDDVVDAVRQGEFHIWTA